jgi:hypothetical protein
VIWSEHGSYPFTYVGLHYDLRNYERAVADTGPLWRDARDYEILENQPFLNLLEAARAGWLKKTEASMAEPEKKYPYERDDVSHYTVGKTETIDFIFEKLGYEGGMAYIIGNLIKYSSRANHKGQRKSDINKIRNYSVIALEKMAEEGDVD